MKEIADICKKYGIENYTINSDGTIDVDGNVYLYDSELSELPLKFGKVSGYFDCAFNKLTTLEGCPQSVGGTFNCNCNKLTTLEGCPQILGDNFYCHSNELITLEGCPQILGGDFSCSYNKLTTLEFCPQILGGDFSCSYNKLTTLEFCPQILGGYFDCNDNKLNTLVGIKVCPKNINCSGNPLTKYEINNPREAILQNIREGKLKLLGL